MKFIENINEKLRGKRKYIASMIILSLVVSFGAFSLFSFNDVAYGSKDDELQQFLQEQKRLEQEMKEQQAALKAKDKELKSLNSQVRSADIKIEKLEGEIYSLEKNMDSADIQMQVANNEMAAEQDKLAKRKNALSDRMRESYINGTPTLLEVFLDSNSMEDFLSQAYYIESLVKYDVSMVDDIEKSISIIDEKKEIIAEKQKNISTMLGYHESTLKEVEKEKANKAVLVAEAQNDKEYIQEEIKKREALSREVERQILALQSDGSGIGTGKFMWPLKGYSRISSNYGYRTHPVTGKRGSFHTGIDIPAPKGTKVYASDSGKVILAGRQLAAYGNCVIIDHGDGLSTLYGHNSKLNVKVGQTVNKGDVIAFVGSTGWSTGNHLHFEFRKNGKHTNPWKYVSKP